MKFTWISALALLISVTPIGAAATETGPAARAIDPETSAAAADIADAFSQIGDQIFRDCIFDLSQEQIDVQQALIQAYIKKGASGIAARRLAVQQITPPKLSKECEQLRKTPESATSSWVTKLEEEPKPPIAEPKPKPVIAKPSGPPISIAGKRGLPVWDCAPNVDYVTVRINGHDRKLTGGEICNPFQDVVYEVPASLRSFRFGYTISTGRLFIVSDNPATNGKTIAWAISGREACRNNPDPDCLGTRSVGSLPPGEYSFSQDRQYRVSWGPKTKRYVAGIYLRKLWNRDQFTPKQTAAMLARGNIAFHVRLKGEMSEACIGLEPKGWEYVASLIKSGRATGVDAHLYEPHPQVAEAPPVIVASTFSFTSLFK